MVIAERKAASSGSRTESAASIAMARRAAASAGATVTPSPRRATAAKSAWSSCGSDDDGVWSEVELVGQLPCALRLHQDDAADARAPAAEHVAIEVVADVPGLAGSTPRARVGSQIISGLGLRTPAASL